jgi:hypothetical protein
MRAFDRIQSQYLTMKRWLIFLFYSSQALAVSAWLKSFWKKCEKLAWCALLSDCNYGLGCSF